MGKGVEKRKFQRLEVPLQVTVTIISAEEKLADKGPMVMKSRNISQEGICLETQHIDADGLNLLTGPPGARDNRLQMEIELFPDEEPFRALGEVCWYDIARDAPEFMYQVGIEFISIHGGGKKQLERFLKAHRPPGLLHKIFG
ncbi:MAG: PilZ domain-containing protein [Desulfobacterota bacterium]|nr:PilZ domain-containing protein [Thermodesulfobacteriota bacterium]